MPAVEVTISGVLFDKLTRTTQQVVLVGEGSLTGLVVGGGPIYPPESGGGGGGGGRPPGIWGGPIDPYPGHPLPQPPVKPPEQPPTNPSDPQWQWAWNPNTGWIPAYVPEGGKPHPPVPAVPQPK